jgi:hypothetical protein
MHQLICPERNRGFQINQYGNNSKDWMTRNEIGMGKVMQPFFEFGWCTKKSSPI